MYRTDSPGVQYFQTTFHPLSSMTNNTAPTPPVTENTEETALSLDTVLTILRRYWFIIILAALAGGTAAYYLAGKQNYIYQKTASVLMRDAKTGSDASSERIMAELNIDPNAANLANESLVLKSTALMNKVVEDLNLNTSYWQKKISGSLIFTMPPPYWCTLNKSTNNEPAPCTSRRWMKSASRLAIPMIRGNSSCWKVFTENRLRFPLPPSPSIPPP